MTTLMWIPTLRPGIAWLAGVMLVASAVLSVWEHLSPETVMASLEANMGLVSLITLAPLLMVPLEAGGYVPGIQRLSLRLLARPGRVVFSSMTAAFVLGSVLNLSALRLLSALVDPVWLERNRTAFATGLGRGFCAALLWSPYFAAVGLVVQFVGVPFGRFLAFALGFSMLWMVLGAWMGRKIAGTAGTGEVPEDRFGGGGKSPVHVAAAAVLMFIGLLALDRWAPWRVLTSVSLVIVLGSALWLAVLRDWRGAARIFRKQYVPGIFFARNEITLFLLAGFFGQLLSHTPLQRGMAAVAGWLHHLGVPAVCLIVTAGMTSLAVLGIHQAVSTMLILHTWDPGAVGLSPLGLGLLLVGSWAVSTSVSPVTPVNLILSEIAGDSVFQIGLRRNGLFAAAASLLLAMYVTGVDRLFSIIRSG
ncbi:MAG: hypothetical protein IRY98_02575 [Alicyclobacillaceae bacterium]|nr:hypothetical protein [Alicyclobacillaceae bacterium]